MDELLELSRAWVKQHYNKSVEHLLKAEEWLRRMHPNASPAMLLATLTHDMERAFPGPDSPQQDPSRGPDDTLYLQAHAERSARIVGDFLWAHQAPEALVHQVTRLIRAHEVGGWPEADWVQAADSLSFLEVNVDLFLNGIDRSQGSWTLEAVRDKFDWMYSRMKIPEARVWAAPLYEVALEKLRKKEEALRLVREQEDPR
jgi:hypothetical protein